MNQNDSGAEVIPLFVAQPCEPSAVMREPSHRDVNDAKLDALIKRWVDLPRGEPMLLTMQEMGFLLTQLYVARRSLESIERSMAECEKEAPKLSPSFVKLFEVQRIFADRALSFDETQLRPEDLVDVEPPKEGA